MASFSRLLTSTSIFLFQPNLSVFGTGFGPVFAGWVENNPELEWRWINWIQCIYTGVSFFALVFLLQETRGSVLLTK